MAFGLRDLAQVAITAVDQTSPAFDSLKRNVADVRAGVGSLQSTLAGLGVGVSAGGFALMIKGAIDAQAALDDLNDTTALAVETLSSLQQTSRIGGHSFDMVTGTATRFAKSVADAAGGNKELLRSFDALGISQERLRAGKFDDLYVEFATKIATAENKTYAIAYATELAGKSAAQALPFFKDLAEGGLEQARVTTQQAEAADRLQKQIGRLDNAFDGIKNQIATGAVPVMLRYTENVREAYKVTDNLLVSLIGMQSVRMTFGNDAAEQIRQIDQALEKNKNAQAMFGKGALTGPILGIRESGLIQARQLAVAQQRQDALAGAQAMGTDDVWSRRAAAANRVAGLPAPPSTPGPADTAGPQLIAQLSGQLAELNGESSEVDKTIRKLTDGTKQYTLEVQASALAIAGEIDEKKRQQQATKDAADAIDRALAVQKSADKVLADFNKTQSEALQNLEFETSLLNATDVQRETAIALRKLENDYLQASIRLVGEETEAYRQRMEVTRQIYEAQRGALPGAVRANVEGKEAVERQKRAIEDAKRQNEDITRSLTDALLRGFENGLGFARNFRESLKNMFSTLVLRPLIQPIAQGGANVIGGLLGAIGIPGYANAGGIGGGIGQSLLTSGFQQYASPILNLGAGASFFGGMGATAGMGAAEAAAMIEAGTAGFAGMGMEAGALGIQAAGATGTALSAAMPYLGAALLAFSALRGNKGGPASYTGMTASGTASRSALDLALTAHSQNSQQQFSWAHEDNMVAPWLQYYLKDVFSGIEGAGSKLGLDTSRLDRARVPFSVNFAGTGSGQDKARQILEQLGGVSDALALELMPNLSAFAQANETATQTLLRLVQVQEQLRAAEQQAKDQLAGAVRGLPGQLGITGLQGARDALSVSEYVSPLQRLSAARGLLDSTFQRGMSGDLTAVNAFPQLLQQALSVGRDVGASGPAFQELFLQGNKQLNDLLSKQQGIQAELLQGIDVSILEASRDQITELKRGFNAVVAQLENVSTELRRLKEAA